MAYQGFAYYYDALNSQADYDALCARLTALLRQYGVADGGIVADLGCGTGECTLRLARAGYDMIGVDASVEMLSVFQDKLTDMQEDILLVCQALPALALYGEIDAAVSTFDTLNHLTPTELEAALRRLSQFLPPGGLFVFDMNTAYKHTHILASETLEVESLQQEGLVCRWTNTLDEQNRRTAIHLEIEEDGKPVAEETFCEYYYDDRQWNAMLERAGFAVLHIEDGESFAPIGKTSQRMLVVAKKQ